MKLSGDARVYLFVLAVSLFMIVWSFAGENYRFESKLLPVLIGSIVVLLAAVGLCNEVRAQKTPKASSSVGSAFDQETCLRSTLSDTFWRYRSFSSVTRGGWGAGFWWP